MKCCQVNTLPHPQAFPIARVTFRTNVTEDCPNAVTETMCVHFCVSASGEGETAASQHSAARNPWLQHRAQRCWALSTALGRDELLSSSSSSSNAQFRRAAACCVVRAAGLRLQAGCMQEAPLSLTRAAFGPRALSLHVLKLWCSAWGALLTQAAVLLWCLKELFLQECSHWALSRLFSHPCLQSPASSSHMHHTAPLPAASWGFSHTPPVGRVRPPTLLGAAAPNASLITSGAKNCDLPAHLLPAGPWLQPGTARWPYAIPAHRMGMTFLPTALPILVCQPLHLPHSCPLYKD